MKLHVTIALSLILLLATRSIGQKKYSTQGSPTVTDKSMSILIPFDGGFNVDGIPINDGDMIGVFYDSLGTEVIAGLEVYSNQFDRNMFAYGNSDTSVAIDGFSENEIMAIKVFDMVNGCVVENADYVLASKTVTWRENETDTLLFWTGFKTSWSYPSVEFCSNDESKYLPVISGEVRHAWYDSDPPGLEIDSLTGEITPSLSLPNNYTVELITGSCLVNSVLNIRISDPKDSIVYPTEVVCEGDPTIYSPSVIPAAFVFYSANSEDLALNTGSGAIDPSKSLPGKYTVYFNTSTCLISDSTSFEVRPNVHSIEYEDSSFCPGETTSISPSLTGGFAQSVTYSVSPAGLLLNPNTGEIDLEVSLAGDYVIRFQTEECITELEWPIRIDSISGEINYSSGPICQSQLDTLKPKITGAVGDGLVYSAPDGLIINPDNGYVDILNSTAGDYAISVASSTCIELINNIVDIQQVQASINYNEAYCPGTITLGVPFKTGPVNSDIRYMSDFDMLSLDSLTGEFDVPTSSPGTYSIEFFTSSCLDTFFREIRIDSIQIDVSYPSGVCGTRFSTVEPIIVGDTSFQIDYSYQFPDLSLNTSTGEVNVNESSDGFFGIEISSIGCLSSTTASLTIEKDSIEVLYSATSFCQVFVDEVEPTSKFNLPNDLRYGSEPGLILDSLSGIFNVESSEPGLYNIRLNSTACLLDSVIQIQIKPLAGSVKYPISSVCQNNGIELNPTVNGTVDDLVYQSEAGLVIDSLTGAISYELSEPGDYYVRYSTSLCLADTGASIAIYEPTNFTESDLNIQGVTCELLDVGAITSSTNLPKPSLFTLIRSEDLFAVEQVDSLIFENLVSGLYQLRVNDGNGCDYNFNVTIPKDDCPTETVNTLLGEESIITPNSQDQFATLTMTCTTGQVFIYNRRAELVRVLDGGVWDGKSDDGELVQPGLYIFYCHDEVRLGEATVLY